MICPKCEFKNAFETNKTKHESVLTGIDKILYFYFSYCPNCDNVWTDARQGKLNREFLEKERIEEEEARRKEEEEEAEAATPAAKAASRKKNLQKDLDSLMALNPFTYLKKILQKDLDSLMALNPFTYLKKIFENYWKK